MLTPEEYRQKAEVIVSKFKDGQDRYKKSALFNRVVQSLVRGADPMEMIDQLITITEDTQKAFERYVERDDRPISFITH